MAALPFDRESVGRLYVAKGRNHRKAIAVLLGQSADLKRVSSNPGKMAEELARALWPGPLTLVVPGHPDLPKEISPRRTIGVRIPDHPVALEILNTTGPLAVTSANLSGEQNTTTADQVLAQLDGRIHLILDGGPAPGGMPSTVVDCTRQKPVILRPGPITLETLLAALS